MYSPQAAGISEKPDTSPLPLPDNRGESQREGLEKGELISLFEKLTEEVSKQNCIIKTLQEDRDSIIQHSDVFVAALRVADRLIASKQRQVQVATRSQAVSTLGESIDKQWENLVRDLRGSECGGVLENHISSDTYTPTAPPSTLPSPAQESSATETTPGSPPSTASTVTQGDRNTSLASTVTPTAPQSESNSSAPTVTSTATQSGSDFPSTVNGVNRGATVCPRTSPQSTTGGVRTAREHEKRIQGRTEESPSHLEVTEAGQDKSV
ncbi:hypothetical protein E2C01_021321 [Portunus trituberculatus]|uniref:Uncharacterized protein n=1 Tax=Portunus trituberculatus TaxID=210409 RepID=A0A5B7E427_PORTR|nr:hypothetical protein [Portunus trituberculatus]